MPYKSTIEDVICILQKPNIQQRKSDASFKEDSLLSSDIVGLFATAKKKLIYVKFARGDFDAKKYKLGANQGRIFAP